jgi:predicted TIM-barrel fold metal-dependent hydrolase
MGKHIYDGEMYVFTMPEQYAEPDLEKRIEYLDQHGIDMQVLSTPRSSDYSAEEGPELARITNDGIAAVVKKYPKRFVGLASIPVKNKTRPSRNGSGDPGHDRYVLAGISRISSF